MIITFDGGYRPDFTVMNRCDSVFRILSALLRDLTVAGNDAASCAGREDREGELHVHLQNFRALFACPHPGSTPGTAHPRVSARALPPPPPGGGGGARSAGGVGGVGEELLGDILPGTGVSPSPVPTPRGDSHHGPLHGEIPERNVRVPTQVKREWVK